MVRCISDSSESRSRSPEGCVIRTLFVFVGDWGGASTSRKTPVPQKRFGRFFVFVATHALLAIIVFKVRIVILFLKTLGEGNYCLAEIDKIFRSLLLFALLRYMAILYYANWDVLELHHISLLLDTVYLRR